MTTGAGFESLGSSPAGYGTPTTALALATTGYQKSTTGCVSSLNVDGRTRDYTYDDYGNEEGMSDTAQRVFLLLAEEQGSRQCSPNTGLSRPQTIGSRFAEDVEARVRRALDPVIRDGSVSLDSVDVDSSGTVGMVVVWWTDRRTQSQGRTAAPLRL